MLLEDTAIETVILRVSTEDQISLELTQDCMQMVSCQK
jgi:hypothetical protein